ncbi:hypothetical protein LTR95_004507 [Oleoguttula sp. CCFEE 5521]
MRSQVFHALAALHIASSLVQAVNLTSSTCDTACQAGAEAAAQWEQDQRASTGSAFYDVPSNFSTRLSPGVLLKIEVATDLANYTVPSGLSMSRIMYTTTNLNNTVKPTSAYIFWPYAALNDWKEEGLPLVAWAHGTSGVLGACAPSNYRNLQYHCMAPYLLALHGMVVVAPDYTGLGVDALPSGDRIHHSWAASPAQQTIRPMLSSLLVPHFRFNYDQKAGCKGTVAFAPPTNVFEALEKAFANTSRPDAPVLLSVQTKLIAGVTASFPAFNYTGFTPLARDRWFNVLEPLHGCLATDTLAFAGVPLDQYAFPNWTQHPTAKRFAQLTKVGGKSFKGPLLIVAGEKDIVVTQDSVQSAVNDTCALLERRGNAESLQMITYQGMNHFPVIQASSAKWLQWVKHRLFDKAPEEVIAGCRTDVVEGFRTEFTPQSITPNFLTTWAPPMEAWKYSV